MANELRWLGHGTWHLTSGKHGILLDPFLTDNPSAPVGPDDVEADFILVSHGHFDHVADVVPIAKRTGATVVSNFEICEWFGKQGIEKLEQMNLGGGISLPFGRVKSTPAWHSSVLPDGTYGGNPGGFLLALEGTTIYFACDTALFSEMQLLRGKVDVAVLPIGDRFTMGPEDALEATKWIEPRRVLPAHYNTWPPIEQDATAWAERVRAETTSEPIVVEPGGKISL